MFEPIVVQSHRGPYEVRFDDNAVAALDHEKLTGAHFIVDARVGDLYRSDLAHVLSSKSLLLIEATEENKSLERMPEFVTHLVGIGIRRSHRLVAIGGGIIQDITCFLAATLLRGLEWHFYPTTLLAQADSCIGSKSSINCQGGKNILGTFTPPTLVFISTRFLDSLDEVDIRSGIGEMLKVHAIDSPQAFDQIATNYEALLSDRAVLKRYIDRSLEIKRRIVEIDEFDKGPRAVMNYGHSFGHAIESATDFGVPHGIAVTIGMDMANFIAWRIGRSEESFFSRMHPILRRNYVGFEDVQIPIDRLASEMSKDKKNTDRELVLILPDAEGRVSRANCRSDETFHALCAEYLQSGRSQ